MRRISWTLGLAAGLCLLVEVAVRSFGAVDIPLYKIDAQIGYMVAPGQSGAFLHRRRWSYNALGMGGPEFTGGGVLLIGDSIVNGGNSQDDPDRLGPQLAARIGRKVWPISAGGWALLNELSYLREHPRLVGETDAVVFVLNSGDFAGASVWRDDPDLPIRRPRCAACYLVRRLALDRWRGDPPPPIAGRDWRQEFRTFAETTDRPIIVVLYSQRNEDPSLTERYARELALDGRITVLPLADDPRWRRMTYRDGVHPDAPGVKLLAAMLADHLKALDQSPRD